MTQLEVVLPTSASESRRHASRSTASPHISSLSPASFTARGALPAERMCTLPGQRKHSVPSHSEATTR
ncbi:hypothetical protein PFLUV_G00162810 [Perca fluviatilis]|uniref:Uncharacterized protein n=1 Tax=Perca fluviatilis TaxID=8168 RepID=A0A6A5ECP2_PERFL|nr:hypothetical protein PFLUV_G00162810 [Perca fluviatilis]